MTASELLLTRLRQRVADARAELRAAHDRHLLEQEKGPAVDEELEVRRAGEALRAALAELRGADAATTAARQGRASKDIAPTTSEPAKN